MPLSKKRDKERKRLARLESLAFQPDKTDLEAKLAKVGLKVGSNGILDAAGLTRSPLEKESNARVPRYNKKIHKPGDRVIKDGVETIVPVMDAEGNTIYEE